MKIDVYACGSALMDMQLHIHDGLLKELGVEKGNMYLTDRIRQAEVLSRLAGADALTLEQPAGDANMAAGGSAANTVFGIAQLGGRAALCGKVARDRFGDLYARYMQDSGVLFNENRVNGMTGTCIVLITEDAQRTMLTCLGVSSEITPGDMDEQQLADSRYLYLEGYLFDSELAARTMLQAIAAAKNNNVQIALTASDSFCVARHKDVFVQLIKNDVDLLFANAQEACALTDTPSTEEALTALSELCPHIAVTDGDRGSVLCFDKQLIRVEPFMVTALDTTGAGDAYAAGLLFGLSRGYSLQDSGRIASFYASRVVSQIGPRYSGDIRHEVKSLKLSASPTA